MNKTALNAKGKWDGILAELAPELIPFIENRNHGPCPHHGGKNGFRLFNDGTGGGICNTCGSFSDGFNLLQWIRGWDFKTTANEIDKIVNTVETTKPRTSNNKNKVALLKRISAGSIKITPSCPAGLYLINRGLSVIPDELSYHPGVNYYNNGKLVAKYPAMLAPIKGVNGGNLTYHVTYLTPEGQKADVPSPRKIMSPIRSISGGAVRLFNLEHEKILVLTEGIESAIAAFELTKNPCWATISAGGMESFQPPEHIKTVLIIGDNDASYTGQKAAYTLANRLVVKNKLEVSVHVPTSTGQDILDQFNAGKNNEPGR